MLEITIPDVEIFISATNEFLTIKGGKVSLEHSLLSISKWEAKHHKYFLNNKTLTQSEILDYIRCMVVKSTVDNRVFYYLDNRTLSAINDYMNDPMTATWFGSQNEGQPGNTVRGKIVTSELLYYYMISFNIPMNCEKWHVNRLLTLIQVCQAEQNPVKLSGKALANRNTKLNEERLKRYHTHG